MFDTNLGDIDNFDSGLSSPAISILILIPIHFSINLLGIGSHGAMGMHNAHLWSAVSVS